MRPFQKSASLLSVLTLSTSLLSGCAGSAVKPTEKTAEGQAIPLVGSSTVHRFTLDNGLRLLVVEDHSSPTFAYQTWYRVGSRDEIPGHTGLAHLFEHMMFKETKNLKDGQFDKILEQAGVEGENAFTSRDYTAYIQELPRTGRGTSDDKLELITRLESDRMVNLVVDEKAFKTETDVVQNERRFRNENSPDGLMFQELFELAFTKHPYHWPVVGYQPDLDSMHASDAVEFYRAYYSPNHATVIIVGDVTPEGALAAVKKHYGDLPGQATPVHPIPAEPEQTSARHKLLKLNMKTEKLLMGYHIPAAVADDIPAISLAQILLTGGKSSRLHRALVDTGIATSVEAYAMDDKDPTLLVIQCNLQEKKKAAQAETIILREISRLAQQAPGEKEMERARNNVNYEFYSGLDSSYEKARFLGTYEALAGNFEKGLEIQKKTLAVTAPEVQAVLKRYFRPTNRSVITGVPK